MSEQGRKEPVSGTRQQAGPAGVPLSGRQSEVLRWGTAVTVVVGIGFAMLGALAWYGYAASPPGFWGPGERELAFVKATLLFPGPWVALLVAWIGYAVFRRRNGPARGVAWFSTSLLIWFLPSIFWSLPWLALS